MRALALASVMLKVLRCEIGNGAVGDYLPPDLRGEALALIRDVAEDCRQEASLSFALSEVLTDADRAIEAILGGIPGHIRIEGQPYGT